MGAAGLGPAGVLGREMQQGGQPRAISETEILELLTKGLANKEIADRLDISVETVRVHLRRVYEKLHVHSRTEAAMKFRDTKEGQRSPF